MNLETLNEKLELLELELREYKSANNSEVENLKLRYTSTIFELQAIINELQARIYKLEKGQKC